MKNIECEPLLYSRYVINACEKEFYFNYESLLKSDSISYCNICLERIFLILDLLYDMKFYFKDVVEPAYEDVYLVFKEHIESLQVKLYEC